MSLDESQLETVTLDDTSTVPLNETSWPERPSLSGQVLDGRYWIEKELGQGGVGAVYLARDRKLHDKPVVIKVLLEKSLQNDWVVQKFQQEKEALARVDHPGVVGILDTGELPDRKPYLVMQFAIMSQIDSADAALAQFFFDPVASIQNLSGQGRPFRPAGFGERDGGGLVERYRL